MQPCPCGTPCQRGYGFTSEGFDDAIGDVDPYPLQFAQTDREAWKAVVVNEQIRPRSDDAAGHVLLPSPIHPGGGFLEAGGFD